MATLSLGARAALGARLTAVLTKHRDVGMSTDAPREVYLLSLNGGESPRDVRRAVEGLAELHAHAQFAVFRELLEKVFPFRQDTFGYGTWCDTMPTLAVEIDTIETLAAAEAFFSTSTSSSIPIELLLEVSVPSDPSLEFLTRVSELVVHLDSNLSGLTVTMVDLKVGRLAIDDEPTLRATSQLCDAMLRRLSTVQACNVSLYLPRGGVDSDGGLLCAAALGELFQSICRVGCVTLPEPTIAKDCDELDDRDCNTLKVEIERNHHPRVAAAWWSAVTYSRGYSCLRVDQNPEYGVRDTQDEAAKTVIAKYFATMLLLKWSDVQRIHWGCSQLLPLEMEAMESVQSAIRSETVLGKVLWDRAWSVSRHGRIFEIATLYEEIVRSCGWFIQDPRHGDWIDVFVPGFGQCSVKRDQWEQMTHSFEPPCLDVAPLQRLSLRIDSNKDETASNIPRLFAVIGSFLTHLTIDTRVPTAGLLSIFESCPLLRHLKVDALEAPREPISVVPSRIVSNQLEVIEVTMLREPTPPELFDPFFASVLPAIGAKLACFRIKGTFCISPYYTPQAPILSFRLSFQILAQACPRLRTLSLERLQVDNLDGLIQAFRLKTSKLASLRLLECPIESTSLVQFAQALRSPGAKNLEFLYINHTSQLSGDREQLRGLDLASLRAFLAAVRVNRSLMTLLLLAQHPTSNAEDSDAVANELDAIRTEDRAMTIAWHRMRSAVALVSALHARSLPWNDEVVRQIMGFVPFECRTIAIKFE
jgi:hypothetical protein